MGRTDSGSRVTVADLAQALDLSPGAVSFALNGRPGVSDETRARVLRVAEERGWRPRTRRATGELTYVIGLALARRAPNLAVESFYAQFIAGLETVLSERSYGLLWQIVGDLDAEMDVYRRWQLNGSVDGVVLVDVRVNDPRVSFFSRPGAMPAVVVGDRSVAGSLTSIVVDDATAMRDLMTQLAADGHRHVVRISGAAGSAYTAFRDEAFLATAESLGLEALIERSDLTGRAAALLTRDLLASQARPTAIMYENDLMTLAGIGVATELGLHVPRDISMLAWDDSPLCAVASPPVSAMAQDVLRLGSNTASHLLDVIDGLEVGTYPDATPAFRRRASTGRAPAVPASGRR